MRTDRQTDVLIAVLRALLDMCQKETACSEVCRDLLIRHSYNKKLSYRRVTARCGLLVVILPIATQQCRNYLYDKS